MTNIEEMILRCLLALLRNERYPSESTRDAMEERIREIKDLLEE